MELNESAEIEISITRSTLRPPVLLPDIAARRALQQEPASTPVMYQTWRDLLFLHWEWDPLELQATLPDGLYIDSHRSKAYVGVIPFRMEDVRASILPEIPGVKDFLELNVRTYVHDRNGRPGVWFYSLDLNQGLGVILARLFYSLPYYNAVISAKEQAGLVQYSCRRHSESEPSVLYYRKEPQRVPSPPDSLASFLVDRFLLYSHSARTKKLYTARVHHAPWDLFHAYVGRYDENMLRLNGLSPRLRPPDHAWIGSPVRVKIYGLEAAES